MEGGRNVSEVKTNVMRILEKNKIPYTMHTYDPEQGIDGVSVAHQLNEPVECVFKTLVTQGKSKNYFVFVIPVEEELNLKLAAKAVGEKSVEMIHVKDINKITGYIRGGCSPVGMKKQFKTVVHESAKTMDTFIVSGGQRGTQIECNPVQLVEFIRGEFGNIIM